MLATTAVAWGLSLALAGPLVSVFAERDARSELDGLLDRVSGALERGETPQLTAREASMASDTRVSILDRSGHRVAGAEPPSTEWWLRAERVVGERQVRAYRRMPNPAAARSAVRSALLSSGVFALLLVGLLGERLTRALQRPLRQMTERARALGRGDAGDRGRSDDELGALRAAIDSMADQLEARFEAEHREEARLRTILDAMIEGVFVTDPEGRIVLTNAALTELAGAEVEGRTAVEAIRSAILHDAVRRATEGEAATVDFDVLVGAQRRSITAQVAPLTDRGGVVAVLHDVTQLRRADAVRRDFVANASHELRTPLTAIRGFAETLEGGVADERMAARFLHNINENAKRLHSLVDDLLELSRAESPESAVELVPVDVVEGAANVLSGLESRAADKRQRLVLDSPEEPIRALADARALDQVLLNLVDNAIKYTPAEGEITVVTRREGDRVVLEVRDTGPGIPTAHLDRIFERFYRVDKGRARGQGGTGLGLSIVRHLVSRMNGEVSVESEVGEGTTFQVRLEGAPGRTSARSSP